MSWDPHYLVLCGSVFPSLPNPLGLLIRLSPQLPNRSALTRPETFCTTILHLSLLERLHNEQVSQHAALV
jgi:hypothetical protein